MKLYINVSEPFARGLIKIARQENRSVRDQIAFILKKELEWRGLLTSSTAAAPRPPTAPTHESEGKFSTNEL